MLCDLCDPPHVTMTDVCPEIVALLQRLPSLHLPYKLGGFWSNPHGAGAARDRLARGTHAEFKLWSN